MIIQVALNYNLLLEARSALGSFQVTQEYGPGNLQGQRLHVIVGFWGDGGIFTC